MRADRSKKGSETSSEHPEPPTDRTANGSLPDVDSTAQREDTPDIDNEFEAWDVVEEVPRNRRSRPEPDREQIEEREAREQYRKWVIKDREERSRNGFFCIAKTCKSWVPIDTEGVGTKHRNHCNCCLASRHLDLKSPGDRKSDCGSVMSPVAMAQKEKKGELMVVHQCAQCHAVQANRIAGDDNPHALLTLARRTLQLSDAERATLESSDIRLITSEDQHDVFQGLFGQPPPEILPPFRSEQ